MYDHLNRTKKSFRFMGTDSNDKPAVVAEGPSVGGQAVQNWTLLRLLPLLIFDLVDVTTAEWAFLLLLREGVELVCAPKLSQAQVLYLNRLVKALCCRMSESLFRCSSSSKASLSSSLPMVDHCFWTSHSCVDNENGDKAYIL